MISFSSMEPGVSNLDNDLSLPTQLTTISTTTYTPKSSSSEKKYNNNTKKNSNESKHEIYFTTQKKIRIKRKNKITKYENKLLNNIDNNKNNIIIKESHPLIPKFKENYLDLLIISYDNMINDGLLNLNYLNIKNKYPKFSEEYVDNSSEKIKKYLKKCENKICAVIEDDPKKIFLAKFSASYSLKSMSLFLCNKCFIAFKIKNYCYYCNTIYRDFEFNQQYYDTKKWISCDFCKRWQHMICEEKKGIFQNIEELVLDNNFKYMCPFCRKEKKIIERQFKKYDKNKFLQIKSKRSIDLREIPIDLEV